MTQTTMHKHMRNDSIGSNWRCGIVASPGQAYIGIKADYDTNNMALMISKLFDYIGQLHRANLGDFMQVF
ncbi:MAG: hypothetical protein IPO25_19775 [Saprospiraceae bacterium]|nr:hypothetical protein [Saprospiraceae bacterium]